MKSVQSLLSVLGLAAAVQAVAYTNGTTVTTTEVVATLTTYCPSATTITTNGKTYTATASETLTITDCPCTIKKTGSTPSPTYVPGPIPVGNATVTTVVTAYTTYCPAATSVVQGNQTYTVTGSTTLTVTNCPCTVSYPATTISSTTISYITTYCPTVPTVIPVTVGSSTSSTTVSTSGTVTIPVVSSTPVPASPPTPTAPVTAVTSGATPPQPTSSGPVQVTNNGAKVGSGIGALAAAGLAMLL